MRTDKSTQQIYCEKLGSVNALPTSGGDHIHSDAVISKLNRERDITLRFIDSSLLQSVCSRIQAVPNCSPRSLYQTNQDAYENESGLSVINLNDQKLRWT